MIDTHCHLDAAEFSTDYRAASALARAAGVTRIIVPGVMVGFGLHLQQQWEALRDHGREVVGHVVRRDPRVTGKDGHPPRFKIEYTVDGATHAVFENVTDEDVNAALAAFVAAQLEGEAGAP